MCWKRLRFVVKQDYLLWYTVEILVVGFNPLVFNSTGVENGRKYDIN